MHTSRGCCVGLPLRSDGCCTRSGVIVIGMLADPASAAAQALGVSVTIEHGEWLDLIENELLGSSGLQGD